MQWRKISIDNAPLSVVWNDIFFVDEKHGWVVGRFGLVFVTEDGGTTWIQQSVAAYVDFNAIFMVNLTTGWIAGDNGTILVYTPL